MTLPTLKELLAEVIKASDPIYKEFGTSVSADTKSDETPVTKIDRLVNTTLCDWATKQGLGFIGEEGNGTQRGFYTLYVDPLDGTEAFLRGLASMTTIATIMHNDGQRGTPIMAVIYNPVTCQTWVAEYDKGTQYTKRILLKPAQVANKQDGPWKTAICAWPGVDAQFATFDAVVDAHPQLLDQKMGAIGIGGGLIASGLLHATAISATSAVETAAMSLLVREAGGVAVNLHGEPLDSFRLGTHKEKLDYLLPDGAIMACNQELAQLLVNLYQQK